MTDVTATEHNRTLIAGIFAELANNNPGPFVDAFADDVRFTIAGSSVWSRTLTSKQALLDLLGMVRQQLVERIRLNVLRILADGEYVVVQADGRATTKKGKPYNNVYCFVYRIAGDKITEVTEYQDTELATGTLDAPAPAARG